MTSSTIIDSFELKLKACVREVPGKRRVFSGLWDGKEVFVKVFEHKTSSQRHYSRELKGLQAFEKHRIETPEIVWYGESPSIDAFKINASSYLIVTEALLDYQEFNDAYRDNKKGLLEKLFKVLTKHHKAGLIQKDLHPGNFLLSNNTLFSLDGDAVVEDQLELSIDTRSDNIALLIAQFPVNDEDDLMDALSHYELSYDQLTNKIISARTKRCKKYLSKVYRQCTEIESTRAGTLLKREFISQDMSSFLEKPESYIDFNPEKLLKNGNTATVAEVIINDQPFVVKRNNYNKNFKTFTRRFRESRASISWRNSFRLINYGFKTPQPVALIERKIGPAVKSAYFVCEKADGPDALEYLQKNFDEKIINDFVSMFQGWQKCQISHGDCKATNFIISDHEILIIDLDAMKEHKNKDKFKKAFKKDIKRWLANWRDQEDLQKAFKAKLAQAGLGSYLPS